MTVPDTTGVSLTLLVLKTRQVHMLRSFYQCLGINFTEEQHGNGPLHHTGHVGGTVLEIYPLPNEDSIAFQPTRLGFTIDHLEQVIENLQKSGVPMIDPPQKTAWGYRAVVKDPDGRTVELYQR